MDDKFKDMANEGIDKVGNAVLNLLPINGIVRNAISFGLDKATDVIFRTTDSDDVVPLKDHPEVQELADNLAIILLGLVDKQVLKPFDFPFLEGANEEMFEEGILLQLKAMLNQAIEDFLLKK